MIIKNSAGFICNVARYDSPEAYADFLEHEVSEDIKQAEYNNNFISRAELQEGIRGLRYGDLELAEKAEKLMDKLRYEGILSVGLPMPSRAVSGAMTILPLYEAGVPNCMVTRQMSDLRGVNAPLNVYWDRFRSSALEGNAATNRGIAITAFIMAMNNIRPVNLYFIACSCPRNAYGHEQGLYGSLIRMETRPLDLARATWIFTNRRFRSNLTWLGMRHRFQEANQGKISSWAQGPLWLRHSPREQAYEDEHREILQMERDDIFLHGMHMEEQLCAVDPVAWIRKMIDKHIKNTNGE